MAETGRASVSIAFVTGILSAFMENSENLTAFLQHAEIAINALDDPLARVPLPNYARLYNHLTSTLDDEGFGLFSAPLRCGSFEFLCRAVLGAHSLEEAIQRASRFLRLILPDLRVSLHRDGPRATLVITETRVLPRGRVFAFEWLLRMLHGLACWLADRSMVLERVDFPYSRPAHAADYALIYTADSRFSTAPGATRLVAHFDAALLELPVRRDEAALAQFLVGAPGRISTLYRRDRETATRVRDLLRTALPASPDLHTVAAQLHLSTRTLHRRLHQEGTGFQTLKDQLRHERALEWLTKTRRPLSRIATNLGYADSTAFYRAFVSWTGEAPMALRKRVLGTP